VVVEAIKLLFPRNKQSIILVVEVEVGEKLGGKQSSTMAEEFVLLTLL
jgi:hypothetical protein